MTKEELEKLLDNTDELDRDILERVVLGHAARPAAEGFGRTDRTVVTAGSLARTLNRDRGVIAARLNRMRERGLVLYDGKEDGWRWAETGLVTEFWQLRTAVNFA